MFDSKPGNGQLTKLAGATFEKVPRARYGSGAEPEPPDREEAGLALSLDLQTYGEIEECFEALAALCRQASGGSVAVSVLSEQVLGRWNRLRRRLPVITAVERG